jgi:hypothetical protein
MNLPLINDTSALTTQGTIGFQQQTINLYQDHTAAWYQHTLQQNKIDVAVINCGTQLSAFRIFHVNEEASAYDMAITIGAEVFLLGYPLGFSHFIETPIWKRGAIASEPHLEGPTARGRIVVDATTRSGMSGSPVIMRANTHYVAESGEVKCSPHASRLIGVYASRPMFQGKEPRDTFAEIGYVYKSGYIEEIIKNGSRAPDYGMLP